MNLRHVAGIFRKDGVELLRDRRAIFVNVMLPVLLYPLLMLFGIQVVQLTQAKPRDAVRIAVVDAPEFAERLRAKPATGEPGTSGEQPAAGGPQPDAGSATPDRGSEPAGGSQPASSDQAPGIGDARPTGGEGAKRVAPPALGGKPKERPPRRIETPEVPEADAAALREAARTVAATPRATPTSDPAVVALSAAMVAPLRRLNAAAAAVAMPAEDGRTTLVVAVDDAHPDAGAAEGALQRGRRSWERTLVERALTAKGLPISTLEPLVVRAVDVARPDEAARTHLAGIVPLILVLIALIGAFYPALDLIAGERERGTLESLLSWPVARRDIFIGKLLVACAAALISVVLNLGSMSVTLLIAAHQLAGDAANFGSVLSAGGSAVALCFVALLPITATIAALSLVLAGVAQSTREAQQYLSPLMIVVLVAAGVVMIDGARPTLALDLIPITGPVLALAEALRGPTTPWLHLGLSTGASIVVAVVIVGWAVKRLESEAFVYPGLVRAGWGRWRRWGERPGAPGALEAMAVYAVAVGGFVLGGGYFQASPAAVKLAAPLLLFFALPPLLHAWLGAYPLSTGLHLARPQHGGVLRALAAAPWAVVLSLAIGALQQPLVRSDEAEREITQVMESVAASGGLPLLLLCAAVVPAVAEELLCRGTLLAGLRRGLGRRWSVVLTSFLFAVLHLQPSRFLPQFMTGVALAVLTLRARSLLPAMLLHALHNGILVTAGWWHRHRWPGHAAIADAFAAISANPWSSLGLAVVGLVLALGGPELTGRLRRG